MKIRILPFLLAMSVSSCGVPDHRDHQSEVQLVCFKTALRAFAEDCGRYPSSDEGLEALIRRPEAIPEIRWKGPYLDPPTGIPLDGWGHAYVYRSPGIHGTNQFEIYSGGTDGVSKSGGDDADDIRTWSLNQRSSE